LSCFEVNVRLLYSGPDSFAVQKFAGHSYVRLTTQTNAHLREEALWRAAGVLDRVGLEVDVARDGKSAHHTAGL